MSKLTLGYWKIRGLAESIRLLLHYLEIEYKEDLYEFGPAPDYNLDNWYNVKYKLGLDYPNVPYLFDGDFKITESGAILRYICGKYKPELLGTTLQEKAIVDMTYGVLWDLWNAKARLMYQGKDFQGSEGLKNTMKNKLTYLNNFLEKNKYLAGDKITYPDFLLIESLESINDFLEPVFDEYPNLKRHFEAICEIPTIKKYRAEREPLPYNGRTAKLGGEVKK